MHGRKRRSENKFEMFKHESTVSETRSVFRNGGPSPISVFCNVVLVIYSSFSENAIARTLRARWKMSRIYFGYDLIYFLRWIDTAFSLET
ncbi:hypothetical protein CEXT_399281 [Caerostris extrusa]|uniref:Uncharacterized protein n=1 Tax=Caerostris extrusa TaxID=172846 RepID=A0AAV4MNY5_CAEEX|nr:hypothetical protein CEXT_399281 [Caerostris extrusa]